MLVRRFHAKRMYFALKKDSRFESMDEQSSFLYGLSDASVNLSIVEINKKIKYFIIFLLNLHNGAVCGIDFRFHPIYNTLTLSRYLFTTD